MPVAKNTDIKPVKDMVRAYVELMIAAHPGMPLTALAPKLGWSRGTLYSRLAEWGLVGFVGRKKAD